MVGETVAPDWLATDELLAQFAERRAAARRRYSQFVMEGVGHDSIWSGLRQQIYLGDDDFVERTQEQLRMRGDRLTIPHTQRRGPPPSIEAIARKCAERDEAIIDSLRHGCLQLSRNCRVFRHPSRNIFRHPSRNSRENHSTTDANMRELTTITWEFEPYAQHKARARGEKAETFDFLGLTHYCARSRNGKRFRMKRKTMSKRFTAKLRAYKTWLKANRTLAHLKLCGSPQPNCGNTTVTTVSQTTVKALLTSLLRYAGFY